MSGASFIIFVNLAVGILISAFFLLMALHDRQLNAARWFTAAYVLGVVYLLGEILIPFLDDARFVLILSSASVLAAIGLLNVGIARRYEVKPNWALLGVVFAVSIVAFSYSTTMPRESMARNFVYQTPFFVMQAIGAWIVLSSEKRKPIDLALAIFIGLTSLHFLSKPFGAVILGGPGEQPQDYVSTAYAMFSQSIGAVFFVAMALVLMAMLVGDMLREAANRSMTDPLSGLLNRRGLEVALHRELQEAQTRNTPLALILADLDHFKDVNDRFGHVAGDNAIVSYAQCLRDVVGEGHLVARMGGEEFAVLLRGANLKTARLVTEGFRVGFPALSVPGIPEEHRLSASYGVAVLEENEDWATLVRRADRALYDAKATGRDKVVVADRQLRYGSEMPEGLVAAQRRSEA
jgi:diguanylate cyclase (GGDEF)-like protein